MNAGGVPNTCKSNGRFEESLRIILKVVSGGRVSNAWGTCLCPGDSSWKRLVIPHKTTKPHGFAVKSVAGLRGRTATLGLRHGPDSYGRQQWGILHNGGNSDAATPRE